MKAPSVLHAKDWPLRITRRYWLVADAPIPGNRDPFPCIFKRFRTDEDRAAWLDRHGYEATPEATGR